MANDARRAVFTQWKLIIEDSQGQENVFPIEQDIVTLGRDRDNDISLDDAHISKHHARFTQIGDELIIEDLNSVNGTVVNSGPLTGPYTLRHNDMIEIGSYTLRVEKRGDCGCHSYIAVWRLYPGTFQRKQSTAKGRESQPANALCQPTPACDRANRNRVPHAGP